MEAKIRVYTSGTPFNLQRAREVYSRQWIRFYATSDNILHAEYREHLASARNTLGTSPSADTQKLVDAMVAAIQSS